MKICILTRLSAVVVLVLSAMCCAAQPAMQLPVSWSAEMHRGDTCAVVFSATMSPGWHLYGLDLPADGPQPTVIDLSGSRGVTFTAVPEASRAPEQVEDELFGMTLTWWDGEVKFSVPFVVDNPADALIEARISYMVCNGESCMPPRTEVISIPIE